MSAKSRPVSGRVTVPLESEKGGGGRNKNGKNKVASHAALL